jgi:hypothetical protein
MSKPAILIDRTGLFIISYQLEGLCTALRLTVPHGLAPGADTLAILKKLVADFASISTGKCLSNLPTITESSSPVDVLAMAETMRTTVLAFLSPEEISEHRRAIGFHPESHKDEDA